MANPDRQGQSDYRRTEQEVANKGFDETFKVPATELLAYNSGSDTLDRVQINSSGELLTSATGGGGSGGTSSSFGSANPSAGTAAGFSDGTNMQEARVFDVDSGAGTQYVIGANLRKSASGGSVEAGTSSDPLRTDPTGTTAQPITDNGGSLTVDNGGTFPVQAAQSGTWNITDISGTVSLPTGAATAAKQPSLGTAGSASSNVITVQGIASMTALKVDGSGVTQPVSGTVTANIGTTNGLALDATLTGGTQQTKLTDGTNTVGVLKSDGTAAGQNAVLSAGTYLSVPFTTTTAQAVGSTDTGNYRHVSVHITTQGGSSTVTFQSSNDNTNWVSTALNLSTSVATIPASSTTSAAVIFSGALTGRYFRLNVTGIASGTTAGTIVFSSQPTVPMVIGAQAAQTGTWTVGANSATGSAVPANAFYMGLLGSSGNLQGVAAVANLNDGGASTNLLASGGMLYNNSNFDRARSVINATNSTGTGIAAVGMTAQFDDVSPTAITENQFGNVRMSANRNQYNTIRDAAGNERGANVNASNQLSVSVDNSNVSTNIAQMNGTTVTMGNGVSGTGVQRVTLASDSTGQVAVTGTVTTAEAAPTTVLNGKTTVTTAGTRVVLAASTTCKSVTIKALAANTGTIYVGSSTVASTNGLQLAAGESISLDIANLNTVNIDASVNGEGVTYLGVN